MKIIHNLHVCTCTVGSAQCPECMVYGFGAMAAIFYCACLCKHKACTYINTLTVYTHVQDLSGDCRQTDRQTHTHILIYLVVGVTIAWTLPPSPPLVTNFTIIAQSLHQKLGYRIHHLKLPVTLDTYYILRHTMHAMTSQQTHFTLCIYVLPIVLHISPLHVPSLLSDFSSLVVSTCVWQGYVVQYWHNQFFYFFLFLLTCLFHLINYSYGQYSGVE